MISSNNTEFVSFLTPLRQRHYKKLALLTVFSLLLSLLVWLPGSVALAGPPTSPRFVSVQADRFWLDGQPIVIKGANYYQRNAPWAEMWKQWYGPQVEREISEAESRLGLNALRILVPYGQGHDWNDDQTGQVYQPMLDRLRQMIQIAGNHGMRVVITLFDFYDPWSGPGRETVEAANLRYLTELVTAFKDDDRVLAWDLHNEPENYSHWQKVGRPDELIEWLRRMAQAVRRLDTNHPLTVGLADYHNFWLETSPGATRIIDLVDFVSFHAYEAPNLFAQTREIKAHTTKPILLEETGWPTDPRFLHPTYNETDQYWFYRRMIEVIQTENLAGATQWLLWDLVAGRRLRPTTIADWMGLFRWDGSLKPAGQAYAEWKTPRLSATTTSQLPLTGQPMTKAEEPLFFPETNHFVAAQFKRRWLDGGGRELFGLPLTEPFIEDGHTIQFFERAVMELYLEARSEPGFAQLGSDEQMRRIVPLRLLGRSTTEGRKFDPATPSDSTADHWYFPQTGHSLSYGFLDYWKRNGGLLQFGYPISEEFQELSATDGKLHTVQYFERMRFEYHPELKGTSYEVELGQLGREELKRRGWLF